MKKVFLLLVLTLSVISCKNSEEKSEEATTTNSETASGIEMYRGEFLYIADAAVLKGDDFIYGVTMDAMTEELAEKVKAVKNDDFDMVPVIVNGIVKNKEEGTEGWDEIITITEILHVSDKPSKADIKIEDKKQ